MTALAAAVLWRKRQAIARAIDRKAVAAILATETALGFLWFTGHLDSETTARYAIAAPITLALLRAAWCKARP